jgi:hypothetical protein
LECYHWDQAAADHITVVDSGKRQHRTSGFTIDNEDLDFQLRVRRESWLLPDNIGTASYAYHDSDVHGFQYFSVDSQRGNFIDGSNNCKITDKIVRIGFEGDLFKVQKRFHLDQTNKAEPKRELHSAKEIVHN